MTRWPAAVVVALLLAFPATARSALAADDGYAAAVDQALQILREARGDDAGAAGRAADALEAGTGQSQREIVLELRRTPPDVADARDQLTALSRAVHSPGFAPEPGRAQRAVNDILAQPRYAALRRPPSLGDRIRAALEQLLIWVLERIGGIGGGVAWLLLAAGVAGLALVGLAVVRSVRWRGRGEVRAGSGHSAAGPARDRFAEADRLAAAGDLDAAVRALAGAVAVALDGDRAWEASPLTVRELFARAPDAAALRPLLLVFEAAVYGDRAPDADGYRLANAAAAPFRESRQAAA